ncbi:MAG: hypothetical protein KF775_12700 [Cyclobacteriaceae bacterium]|nr:hypothetical protein [Cyclobacteriaceae bacterium]
MSFKLQPTPPFERELKRLVRKYPSIKKDITALCATLLVNPTLGIPIGNNCYKIRMSITSKGRGKSGGGRVITYVKVIEKIIFLIAVYDKSELGSVSDALIQERLKNLK